MPTYEQWNTAIVDAFTRGVPSGAPVYLAVDDEALEEVGAASFPGVEPQAAWVEDFRQALRAKLIGAARVQLGRIDGQRSADGPPDCVAFLGAMVLAACRMQQQANISELSYFQHLREFLGVDEDPGPPPSSRPAGMPSGREEPLWEAWNGWLSRRGFLPTASRGPEGGHKYINYPLSQALIREADRQHLDTVFRGRAARIPQHCDPQTLAAIAGDPNWPTAHLREVMSDGARRAAAEEVLFEAYESWKAGQHSGAASAGTGNRPLIAGLYREEDPIGGTVGYRLFARMRRGRDSTLRPTITQEGQDQVLRPMREGWYEPTEVHLDVGSVDAGARYPLAGLPGIDAVELPQRAFWMLVPEPEDPASGLFASWGPPRLGEPFILLARETLLRDLQLLKDEGLVVWDGEPRLTLPGWVELHGFLAVSEAWDGVHTQDPQLFLELRPRSTLSISVSGGLRSPTGAWLEGYGPEVVVHGFEGTGEIARSDLSGTAAGDSVVFQVNVPVSLQWGRAGTFRVVASTGTEESPPRLVRVESWDSLQRREPERPEVQVFGEVVVNGATVSAGGGAPP